MNLLSAVTYLRTNILDDIGGIGVSWETFTNTDTSSLQLRWTNEELVSNVEEAIKQVYRRILPVKEVNPLFDITTVEGTSDYVLDSRILQIEGIRSSTTNKTLCRLDLNDVWLDKDFTTLQGTPEYFIPNYDTGSIRFYRIPKAVDTYNLLIYRLPLSELSWSTNTKAIELRDEFIVPMLFYATALCYEKDEANVLDPTRSLYFHQKFNQEFPMTSSYSDVRKRRTSNKEVKYGGL